MDTSGYYKIENDALLSGKRVTGPDFELTPDSRFDNQDTRGWEWFDSVEDAVVGLGYIVPSE